MNFKILFKIILILSSVTFFGFILCALTYAADNTPPPNYSVAGEASSNGSNYSVAGPPPEPPSSNINANPNANANPSANAAEGGNTTEGKNATGSANATEGEKAKPIKIIVSVRYGDKENTPPIQFGMNSGDSAFIPTKPTVSSVANAPPPPPDPRSDELRLINGKIAAKFAQIAAKQKQIDREIYPVTKHQEQIEQNNLQAQLQALQAQKAQMEAQQSSAPPQPPESDLPKQKPDVVSGLGIKATIKTGENNSEVVALVVQVQGEDTPPINLEIPLGKWVQIPSQEGAVQKQSIWVKVDIAT